ncbi:MULTISPECIES: ATP-binding cassette domain-containing protein [pseudomallei group]|uniref:ABC transporter ATP-binding protein n=7 Tax=pseudomallei group TaxID=111527 RepID=A0AAX1X3I2_BURML|nr:MULTISPECIES: ABC transporter ATP-binding protein [pseudomallei group]ABA48732.1 putative ABC transport system, membrane protein [Burkholderia pseudomallei 1710b]ABM50907.1 ABC transporter, Fe-S cluster assembly protein [Burkholderia mallei SAVP1]ABN02736.1 putative ABC transport system, membrane protein [Burkholderia mallei NCTC 10229]ABO04709.1 putative ABC transport system, membrane protein [Burkholderia mallei NCTC 10247]AIO50887.1 ABC transporter family protein [Burkholderia mallei]
MKLAALRSLADVIRLMLDKETHARRPIVAGVLVEALTSAFMLLGPIALKLAVDEMARPRFDAAKASVDIALFAVLWSASAISSIALLAYTGRIVHAVSNALLRRALHAQLPALASRASSDSGYVQGLLERLPYSLQVIIEGVLWKIVPVAIQLAVALVLIALLVPLRYAAILFAVLAAYFVFSHLSAEQYEKSAATTNEAAGALSAALGDVLANAPRVVYNGALAREIDYVGARAGARLDVDWRRSWLLTRAAACQYGIIALGMAAMFVLCVRDIAAGRITLGDFMLLQTYVLQFALPLGAYGFVLRQAGAALANVREALDIAPRPAPAAAIGAAPPPGRSGAPIAVRRLAFRRADRFAIEPMSFDLPAGSYTAIVGHNGSGKSTLAKIVAGRLAPDEGVVAYGDVDLYRVASDARHRFALYVPQDVALLNRSLRENVRYYPSTLTDDDAARLLERLAFHKDGRPIDLDGEVGEGGARLSGGQVQKVELVRLMGVDVPAIVLDETTSGLDPHSDALGIAMLRERLGQRTTLVLITHRIANVEAADQVLFLSGGRLVAAGPHRRLVDTCDEYRAFWRRQPEPADAKA